MDYYTVKMKRLWVILFVIPLFAQKPPDKIFIDKFIKLESKLNYKGLKKYFHSKSEDYQYYLVMEEMGNLFKKALEDSVGQSNFDFYHKIFEVKTISIESEFLVLRVDIDYGGEIKILGIQEDYKGRMGQYWIFRLENNDWKLWTRVNLNST